MQYGFVIDHTRCIGCHACTVACKAENDVPLGKFRTWVKYTERGTFPEVRRSFAVLRCNQCSDAPCVEICPVRALEKRPDGIVDVDPARCIGCKGCMQACPYDALYLNEDEGVAEKCHFCAHRVERGLAPACAIVCPTEAIVPGDFHDPESRVSKMRAEGGLASRKPEAGTRPNVFYRDVDPAGIRPQDVNHAGGYLWAEQVPGAQLDAQVWEALEARAEARAVYDVQHPTLWGGRVVGYLFTKSLAAGAFLAALPLLPPWSLAGGIGAGGALWAAGLAMLFLLATTALLVGDLKRPARFLYILRYPQWRSWLAKGAVVLTAYGGLLAAWLALAAVPDLWAGAARGAGGVAAGVLGALTGLAAAAAAAYSAWLFHQAKGRVLWLRRGLAPWLLAHALASGAALLLVVGLALGWHGGALDLLRLLLAVGLAVGAALSLAEGALAPRGRAEEYRRAARLVSHGPWRFRRWAGGIALGAAAPLVLLALPHAGAWGAAAFLALVGVWIEQDVWIDAGQAPAIS